MSSAWRRRPAAALYCNVNPRVAFGQQPQSRRMRVYRDY